MTRRQCVSLFLALGLLATASVALAGKPAILTATPLDPSLMVQGQSTVARPDCLFGNLNDPRYFVGDFLIGNEAYKFLFNPMQGSCQCPAGFQLRNVHIFLYAETQEQADVPLTMWVDLEDAAWDPVRQCWVPGVQDCVSPPYTVTLGAPGLYDVTLPIPCDCAFLDYWYMISVHFGPLDGYNDLPNIVVDAGPALTCYNWNNYNDEGWYDLTEINGWVWNLAMYADGDCCETPVPAEDTSWGQVKQLYR